MQTPAQELKASRKEIGFSIAIMAQVLGIKKPTLQGYESGRRPCPDNILTASRDALQKHRDFWANMDARADAAYPKGIISAPVEE